MVLMHGLEGYGLSIMYAGTPNQGDQSTFQARRPDPSPLPLHRCFVLGGYSFPSCPPALQASGQQFASMLHTSLTTSTHSGRLSAVVVRPCGSSFAVPMVLHRH